MKFSNFGLGLLAGLALLVASDVHARAAGYTTNGLPTIPNTTAGASYGNLLGGELVATDTGLASGANPQSVAASAAQIALIAAGATQNTATATGTGGTSTVTLSTQSGTITSGAITTAAGATHVMTVTDTVATAANPVYVNCQNLAATTGRLRVVSVVPAAGSFVLTLINNTTAAINGTVTCSFYMQ